MPDLRTTRGKRDFAALRLLADAGLRRSGLCALTFEDVDEHARLSDPRLREAIRESTRPPTVPRARAAIATAARAQARSSSPRAGRRGTRRRSRRSRR